MHVSLLTLAFSSKCSCVASMASYGCFLICFSLPSSPPLPCSGLEFPWGPKPFAEVVAGPLLRNNRQTTDSSSLEGHYVGVYFSAHWVSAEKVDKEEPDFSVLKPPIAIKTQGHQQRKGLQSWAGRGRAVSREQWERSRRVEATPLCLCVYINSG